MGDHSPGTDEHGHEHLGHPLSVRFLVGILMALLFLTVVTVGVSYIEMGRTVALLVALLVAVVKASLVALFFMHLRWDKPFNSVILVASMAFLILFIAFAKLDTGEYMHEITPMTEAPGYVEQGLKGN